MAGIVRSYSNQNPTPVKRLQKVSETASRKPDPGEPAPRKHRPLSKPWTDEAIQDVIHRYETGDSMEQIQRDTGYGAERVKVKLIEAGIAIHPQPRKLTPDMIVEATNLRNQGETYTSLARRYGVSVTSARKAITKCALFNLSE